MQRSAQQPWASVACFTSLLLASSAHAQAATAPTQPPAAAPEAAPPLAAAVAETSKPLNDYYKAFATKHLLSTVAAKGSEVKALLAEAERLTQLGRADDAALLLFELTQHPRFADYSELEELDAAHYALGSALYSLGAQASARAALRHVLAKGPSNPYFAPAFRRYVDVSLAGEPLAPAVAELGGFSPQLPEDAQNELNYLQARERTQADDTEATRQALQRVTRHSRFYASAQYLLGTMASHDKSWHDAEGHFCKIASAGDDGRFSFYVDQRYFRIKDLARLGLGRVAHEQQRGDDAFYYYFQVPTDSPRLPEAMFEAAYARYEHGDFETATDLLDQLEARFPRSAYADEAALLRGYVALSHCEFDTANRHFEKFITRFEPVLHELTRIIDNPARREVLYSELLRNAERRTGQSEVHRTLLALLRIDPVFHDLNERVEQLDREAARAGRLTQAFELLSARYQGSDRPRAVAVQDAGSEQVYSDLKRELSDAEQALHALDAQLDAMRALGAKSSELAPHEQAFAALATRLRKLDSSIDDARFDFSPDEVEASDTREVPQLLARDARSAADFPRRSGRLRRQLVAAANERAHAELAELRERLGGFVRRARIGRIDAVMGSKRRVEIQIESLAAGRFPAELQNPLLVRGFLNDDEEYWPFEGEDWPDEFLERYGEDTGSDAAKQKPKEAK